MEENRIREHYVFFGRVQGVGFRYRAKYVANGLRITGWVRNCLLYTSDAADD